MPVAEAVYPLEDIYGIFHIFLQNVCDIMKTHLRLSVLTLHVRVHACGYESTCHNNLRLTGQVKCFAAGVFFYSNIWEHVLIYISICVL